MECDHKCDHTRKYIDDALKALKSIERLTDNMMEEECDPVLIDPFYFCARNIFVSVCPQAVKKLYPQLQKDNDFCAFIEHVYNHCNIVEKQEVEGAA